MECLPICELRYRTCRVFDCSSESPEGEPKVLLQPCVFTCCMLSRLHAAKAAFPLMKSPEPGPKWGDAAVKYSLCNRLKYYRLVDLPRA